MGLCQTTSVWRPRPTNFVLPPSVTFRRIMSCSVMSDASSAHRTRTWKASRTCDILEAAHALRAGHLVAFPTETVYGLGADASSDKAVRSIFVAKGRPADNPLIVHLASKRALCESGLTKLPLGPVADELTSAFWPGPLTVILPCSPDAGLSPLVTAGLDSVAVRVPQHPVALSLLAEVGVPIAAPSANRSGRPSPTEPEHVLADLDGRIYGVVDNDFGALDLGLHGLESTVVDLMDESSPTILRPGALSIADLERVAGISFRMNSEATSDKHAKGEKLFRKKEFKPRAPGMKYRHYAPHARLVLCEPRNLRAELFQQRAMAKPSDRIGLLADAETVAEILGQDGVSGLECVECGRRGDAASVGRALYSALRAFDGEGPQAVQYPGVKVIVATTLDDADNGIATAIMNRLRKAASSTKSQNIEDV